MKVYSDFVRVRVIRNLPPAIPYREDSFEAPWTRICECNESCTIFDDQAHDLLCHYRRSHLGNCPGQVVLYE